MPLKELLEPFFHKLSVMPHSSFLRSALSSVLLCSLSFLCLIFRFLFSMAWSVQKKLIDWTLQTEYSPSTVKTFRNGKPVIVTSDPKFAGRVLNMKPYPSRRPICQRLKDIEETQDEHATAREWSRAFEIMKETFRGDNMYEFVEKCGVFTDRYIQALAEHLEERTRDWNHYRFVKYFSIDTMMYAVYGMDLRLIDDSERPLLKHLEDLGSPDKSWFSKKIRELLDKRPSAAVAFHSIGIEVLDYLDEENWDSRPAGCPFLENYTSHPKYSGRSEEDFACSLAMLLILAGAENIAFTLYACLYLLARNPKKQSIMREEIFRVLGDRKQIELKDLKSLKYVQSVVIETLRLFPNDAHLRRVADKTGSICGVLVEKGTTIEVNLRDMNLNHENFPDPWNFKPERFLDIEEVKKQKLEALLFFGSGHGGCIAMNFSLNVIKMFVASFFLNFTAVKTSKTPILFYLPADKTTSDHFANKNKFESEPLYIGVTRFNRDEVNDQES